MAARAKEARMFRQVEMRGLGGDGDEKTRQFENGHRADPAVVLLSLIHI